MQMQGKISMDLSFCQSENGFSLDELVTKLAEVYDRKAFAELLKMILQMVQELLMYRIFHGETDALKCCDSGHLRQNGSFERRIRTSLGEFKMRFWRVSCSACGKSFSPLQRFIHLGRYQTKTNELEQLIVEAASETNYRRAVQELARDGKLPVSFHTAHGWVLRTDCDEIDISRRVIGSAPIQIMPDGTGFKGEGRNGVARKGDLTVVIGITQSGEIFPLGSWANTSWNAINQRWKEQEVKFHDGSILICDGELGLSRASAEFARNSKLALALNRELYPRCIPMAVAGRFQ
uniref:ISH6 family transposase n=1 Tax=Victivallis vadensis TaxID=172901 RepID=UPI0011CC48F5